MHPGRAVRGGWRWSGDNGRDSGGRRRGRGRYRFGWGAREPSGDLFVRLSSCAGRWWTGVRIVAVALVGDIDDIVFVIVVVFAARVLTVCSILPFPPGGGLPIAMEIQTFIPSMHQSEIQRVVIRTI